MRDNNEGEYWGGGGGDSCDHGLSRRPFRVKPPTVGAGNKNDYQNQNRSFFRAQTAVAVVVRYVARIIHICCSAFVSRACFSKSVSGINVRLLQ